MARLRPRILLACALALLFAIAGLADAKPRKRDGVKPSVPRAMVSARANTTLKLAWKPARDNVKVVGYRVYKRHAPRGKKPPAFKRVGKARATARSFVVRKLVCGTRYTLAVTARDAAGNESKLVPLAAATSACSPSASPPPPPPTPPPPPVPPPPAPPPPQPPPAAGGLHVSGNQLLDASNNAVRLRGVNVSGTEYACIQGWGFHDDHSADLATVHAIRSWNINVVRVPLNETCWLGINGSPAAYSGANYRNEIVRWVNLLTQEGLYVELSLMWAAPWDRQGTYQPNAPNADHSPDMWRSMAQTFKGRGDVILAPWGETIVNADCFLDGGMCEATFYDPACSCDRAFEVAGMQQAVDVMREEGYIGPIAIPGLNYANDLTQWLSHKPTDPMNQLVAEAHVYYNNVCGPPSCLNQEHTPVAAQVPLIYGEVGHSYDDSDCGSANFSQIIDWAESHGVDGYAAWTWNTWGTCGSLIDDFDGTPRGAYGSYLRTHLLTTG